VQARQTATESLGLSGIKSSRLDPLEHQTGGIAPDREHFGHRQLALAQPAQSRGLGLVLAGLGPGSRLDERAPAGFTDRGQIGLIDIAACDRPQRCDRSP
jgi:hypothetical protein